MYAMLETPHVALGLAIATAIPNPYISIPLAFTSHFILDMVPHWNPHFYSETKNFGKPSKFSTTIAVIDELAAIALTLSIAYSILPDLNSAIVAMMCSFASVLPDQIKFPFFFFKQMRYGIIKKWTEWERSIQVEVGPFWGILTQVLVVLGSLYIIS